MCVWRKEVKKAIDKPECHTTAGVDEITVEILEY